MPDTVRSEVEEFGRVELDERTSKFLSRAKVLYSVILAVILPLTVSLVSGGDGVGAVVPYMLLAGIVEQVVLREGDPKARATRAFLVFSRLMLPYVGLAAPMGVQMLYFNEDGNARGGAKGCEIFPCNPGVEDCGFESSLIREDVRQHDTAGVWDAFL